MISIRRALLLFYSFLMAVALAAVSLLVYRETEITLEAKRDVRQHQLREHYEEQSRLERLRLDGILLDQARTLANQAQVQQLFGQNPWLFSIAPLHGLSAALDTRGVLVQPALLSFWAAPGRENRIYSFMYQQAFRKINFDEDLVHRTRDAPGTEYFQIDTSFGLSWRSRSMGSNKFVHDKAQATQMQSLEPRYEDIKGFNQESMRVVMLKAPVAKFGYIGNRVFGPPPRGRGNSNWSGEPARGQPQTRPATQPNQLPTVRPTELMYIRCASETARRDAAILRHHEDYQSALADLNDETSETLRAVRNRLVLIVCTTFLVALAGGLMLVRLGLSPLHRLSVAVSRVSPKDFKLPYEEVPMPVELRPIVARLRETLDELRRVFAREKQAAANISHELRTPLAALLTTIDVCLKRERKPEDYRATLLECREAGKQMNRLVERLLILARLDAGVDPIRPQEIDAAALSSQCVDLVRPLAEARGLSLRFERNGPVEMTTDPDKLREVVTNLLHNAIEYNRPQGEVSLSIASQSGSLQLEVSDTGVGIAPEAKLHIFERFYREDVSRGAEGMHTGLGLSIVKGYVDLLGGSIQVESEPGRGSTFRLRLPVACVANPETPSSLVGEPRS